MLWKEITTVCGVFCRNCRSCCSLVELLYKIHSDVHTQPFKKNYLKTLRPKV